MSKIVESIIPLYILIFPIVAYTFLRMSSKQLISVLTYFLVAYILVGFTEGFNSRISMLISGTIIQIIVFTVAYIFYFRKESIKFNEPLFDEDDNLKTFVKIIKEHINDK